MTTSMPISGVPRWDVSKTHCLAFNLWWPQVIDWTISLGTETSLDGNGIAFEIFNAADFLAYFGTVPMPRPVVGECVGKGAAVANWTASKTAFTEQVRLKAIVRQGVLDQVPADLLAPMMDVRRSLRLVPTTLICSTLLANLGTLKPADITELKRLFALPYDGGILIDAFLADKIALLNDLSVAKQPIPQLQAIETIQACMGVEYANCFIDFVKKYPILATRTIESLISEIIFFHKNILPFGVGKSLLGANSAVLSALEARVDVLTAALVTSKAESKILANKRKLNLTGPSNKTAKPKITPDMFSSMEFCWSHGPCGHASASCSRPYPNHVKNASWLSQHDSKWESLFLGKGWRIA